MANEPGFKSLGTIRPKHAVINGSGTTTIVSGVTGKKISVIGFLVTGSAIGTMTFKSDTDSITGAMSLGLNGGTGNDVAAPLVGPYMPDGHFETAVGEALKITASAGTASGYVTYIEV